MRKLMERFQRFMQGRNGLDELGRMVFVVSVVLGVLSSVFENSLLYYLSALGCMYSLFRMFSRNRKARGQENQKYLGYLSLIRMKLEMRKDYKVFRCKSCGRNIRVPRGKGRIEVTCPLCGNKTIHRT